jgi:hypothetical protein
VSFVFLHSGAPFAKKGGSELDLPKMDIPIGLVQWEVFLPERYQVKNFGGDALSTNLLPPPSGEVHMLERETSREDSEVWPLTGTVDLETMRPGQVGGFVVDQSGAVVPGASVTVSHEPAGPQMTAVTDSGGRWIVSNVPSGKLVITAFSRGFTRFQTHVDYDVTRPQRFSFPLKIGAVTEQVEVTGRNAGELLRLTPGMAMNAASEQKAASANVGSLQRRVAGVLPIAVDVPRAGNSYRFVRPLVLDEETKLTFTYKTK